MAPKNVDLRFSAQALFDAAETEYNSVRTVFMKSMKDFRTAQKDRDRLAIAAAKSNSQDRTDFNAAQKAVNDLEVEYLKIGRAYRKAEKALKKAALALAQMPAQPKQIAA